MQDARRTSPTYNSRFYEGRYVKGIHRREGARRSGVAGYIASFPIPEVVMGIDAFVLGAQSVNPDFKLKVVWANTWFDAGQEADAAKAADRPVASTSSPSTPTRPARCRCAEERGIKAFGQCLRP